MIVRQRVFVVRMTVYRQRAVVLVVGIESQIGGNPYHIAPLHHVGHIVSLQLRHHRRHVFTHQLVTIFRQAIQSVLDINPYRTVLFDVAEGDVGSITAIAATADVFHAARLIETVADDTVARYLPQGTLAVAIHLHGILRKLITYH